MIPDTQALREPAVLILTGQSRSSMRRAVARGEFPAPFRLAPAGARARAVAWSRAEVEKWIAARIAERDAARSYDIAVKE